MFYKYFPSSMFQNPACFSALLQCWLPCTSKASQLICILQMQLVLCMSQGRWHVLQVDWTLATDLLIDLFFMSDIFLNFNTGFISDQVSPEIACCLPDTTQPTMTKASPS